MGGCDGDTWLVQILLPLAVVVLSINRLGNWLDILLEVHDHLPDKPLGAIGGSSPSHQCLFKKHAYDVSYYQREELLCRLLAPVLSPEATTTQILLRQEGSCELHCSYTMPLFSWSSNALWASW